MTARAFRALALGLIALLVFSPLAGAAGTEKKVSGDFNEDLLVGAGSYTALIVHLAPGDKMTVTVQVGLGSEIDLYTMPKKDYEDYKSTTSTRFGYYSQFSKENMRFFTYAQPYAPSEEGDYVIVLDNLMKSDSGAAGTSDVSCTVSLKVTYKEPFPWMIVAAIVLVIIVAAIGVFVFFWMRKKRADIEEADKMKKRLEAAKVRPIFIGTQPAAPGAAGAPAAPLVTAPPPSSTCKSCPHIYDATSANCIACEYR